MQGSHLRIRKDMICVKVHFVRGDRKLQMAILGIKHEFNLASKGYEMRELNCW